VVDLPQALSQPETVPAWQQITPLTETLYKVNIDAPGGAQIRHTGDGMAVYMLFAQPGIYLNDHNKRVPDVIAAAAGFDTERWGKERRKREAIAKATQAIDAEYNVGTQRRVIAEHDEYRVVEIQPGYYNIEFDDGTILNTRGPVSEEIAMRRFYELTGLPDPSAAADASQPADADVESPAPKRAK
jgi:hypothetical protein